MINHYPHHLLGATSHALLHSLWQVSLLGLFAALSFSVMGRAAAWQRHAVGLAWMLAMVAVPLLNGIAYFQQWSASGQGGSFSSALSDGADIGAVPSWTDWLLPGVTLMWLVGVVLMLTPRCGAWLSLRGIDRPGPVALPAEWTVRVEQLRAAFGILRTVTVHCGATIAGPFTAYVLRPVIWIPLGLLTKLPTAQLTALLAHELAHVRRLDWVWNLVQHGVETVLFYHPAMWWLSRRIREERELACDALAAEVCGDPLVLAEALANLQRERVRLSSAGLALAAHGGVLSGRVAHLIQEQPERKCEPHHGAAGLFFVGFVLCCTLVAALQSPHALLVNMVTRESMAGPLSAGNFREFSANYLLAPQRYYRLNIDAQGRSVELYREDGMVKPIDGEVRSWVSAMTAMHNR